MPTHQLQPIRRCRHIFTAGHQCGSPCLRGEQFCYYHHTNRRPVPIPGSTPAPKPPSTEPFVYTLPNPEDRASILAAVGQVMQAIAHEKVSYRQAGLILYSLQTALAALPKEHPSQSLSISAAAARPSRRNSTPVSSIPAPPPIDEVIFDQAHGLIAPETTLLQELPEPQTDEEEEDYDPGDDVQEDGRLLRDTLGYKLLKQVEIYEARQEGYEQARADLLKDGKLHAPQPKARQENSLDIDAAVIPTIRACSSAHELGVARVPHIWQPHRQMWNPVSRTKPHISEARCVATRFRGRF